MNAFAVASLGKTKKHGASFQEAKTASYNENALEFFDEKHSENEDRFLLLGQCAGVSEYSLFVIA